jgi:hypothetical protein
VFRRRREGGSPDSGAEKASAEGQPATEEPAQDAGPEKTGEGAERRRPGKDKRDNGPWDASELDDLHEGRADLGGLLIPVSEGLELRVEVQEDQVVGVAAIVGQSAIQLQAFAAPRSEGIWEEIRGELAGGITQQGGTVDTAEGPFGTELRAQVPVDLEDGTQGAQMLRFIGCDGPRWFLRGVISGEAAVNPETGDAVEELFRGVAVVRGADPMAPRDPIPLRLPEEALADSEDAPEEQAPNPFERGPEITEVR